MHGYPPDKVRYEYDHLDNLRLQLMILGVFGLELRIGHVVGSTRFAEARRVGVLIVGGGR